MNTPKTPDTTKPELTEAQLAELARALDDLRQQVENSLGEEDARYIRDLIAKKRFTEIAGRVLLHVSFTPLGWGLGVTLLSMAKILENMEIGHNVMHGQFDWMNDPALTGATYEWDNVCDGDSWRQTHNVEHHTYTNIIGKDRDYGYDVLRMSDDTPWHPGYLLQYGYFALLSLLFQWGVALHELDARGIRNGSTSWKEKRPFLGNFFRKASRQVFKDYVFFPLLAGPFAPKVFVGNLLANGIRNLWSSAIIFCGHFPDGTNTFSEAECENESRGHWYLRQILGSANITGGPFFHQMSGNLSHQIEHHLFPDIPANRYAEMAPQVEAICKQFGIPYNKDTFFRQYGSVLKRIGRYSLPDGLFRTAQAGKPDTESETAEASKLAKAA